jgi:UDP-N-acetylmuramyl pentapeptide phosphotransferase/UDP-N-acetylglucosamine-1-phosphate transferase
MFIILHYGLLILVLLLIGFIYNWLAEKHAIVDNPNSRSSHTYKTIRGGGIVFWVAGLIYLAGYWPGFLWFFVGLTIVALVSFIDDLYNLGQWSRLASHLAGITVVFIAFDFMHLLHLYIIIAGYILFIGTLNAYNFMDGINGITGMYSLSVLGALQLINLKIEPFTAPDFIWYPMIACIVFLFFNFRKTALCFAGDVGSISIAFWILTLILILSIKTGIVAWMLLLAVYGIDSILTIIHRLYLRENIFKAHRLHFYQALANDCGIDHRIISVGYAIVQALASLIVICFYKKLSTWTLEIIILTPLAIIYCLKFRLLKKKNQMLNSDGIK